MRCPSCGNENREGAKFCDSCGARLEAEPARSAPPEADLPEGVGDGRYRLERFLGQGGRKRVYLARDTAEDRQVAVALFETEGIEETVLARARREAQAMSKLGDHPHIVAVYDSGEDGGRPYMVSEYMPGGDVEGILDAADGRRLEIAYALRIGADICRALEHAHARGIVHRDLKPANVWLAEDGSARLGDFGLATTDRRSRAALEGMLVGTVAYLPPEQALGRASDARADLYSLGGLLYEMLTGQPPFPGDDAVAIISQHLSADPVPPSRHSPAIPDRFDELVLRLLAKSPDERPANAAEVRDELEAIAALPAEGVEGEEREEENPLERLAGGVFVGRERELADAREALESALGGRGGLLVFVGEPGIGKTRTAEELATYARVRGAKAHWGRCHEGEGAPPYWPWAEAIRSYVREADPVGLAWELGQGAPEVAQIVPEVRERLGEVPDPPRLEPEQARFRLFDSVSNFLAGASRSRPLVLVLDDLHWADEPSLLLLKFLARQLRDTGLLLVGTYRDVELGRHHPLARTLGELAEVEGARRIILRGLGIEAISRYIEMTAGTEPPAGLAEAVREQTEGNPFFVSEVVRLLASEGNLGEGVPAAAPGAAAWELAIPQGVREVVGRRLDRLSEEANEVLALAAAIGRQFSLDTLTRICETPRDQVLAALTEAVDAQVVAESRRTPGLYSFSHALVRETLYAELHGTRRVQVHGEIAAALEHLYASDPEPHLGELAHHFIEAAPAGDPERAAGYAERAARQASERLAHEDAVTHYERALEVLELKRPPDRARRLELMLALGEAGTRAGRFVPARETLEAAAEAARELGDPESLARAALGVSALSEAGSADERIITLVEQALEAIGPGDSGLRAELLTALSQELYWVDPEGKAAPLSLEALEMARRVGADRALALALTRRQFVATGPETIQQRLEECQELHDLAKRLGDLELELRAHVYRLRDYLELGEISAVDRDLKAYERLAAELRMPQHLWHAPLLRGMRVLIEGRFEEAERLAAEALAGGERAQEPLSRQFYAIQLSLLRRHQGRMDEILPAVEAIAERYPAIPAWRCALANIKAELGDAEGARTAFEPLAARGFERMARDAQWMMAIALLSEAAAVLGDRPRCRRLYELLLPYDGRTLVAGRAAACYGPVSRVLGLLAAAMNRPAEAIGHFEAALELCARMGERPFAARTRFELARLLLERKRPGDRERGLDLLASAIDAAREMRMRSVVEWALALRLEAQGLSEVDVTTSIDFVIEAVSSEQPDLAAHAAPDGTVTILFSDIEDSTLMTERLGDERWIGVLRAHNEVFRRNLRAHGGYEVKNQGDGFMLVFSDPGDALRCAVAIQRQLAERELTAEERISVRMGMHAGEAIAEEGDFFGRSVILAARIAARAQGGEILVSQELRERAETAGARAAGDGEPGFAAGGDGVSFGEARELELKGLAGTHTVYPAEWKPAVAAA